MLLGLACLETLLIALGIEIAAGVGSVHLVHEQDLPVVFAELVLGIHKDKPLLGSNLLPALEEREGILLQLCILVSGH